MAPTFKEVSADEVARHNTASDCWIIIYDKVYDVTPFLSKHPAGAAIILKVAGKDATAQFAMYHKPEAVLRLVAQPYTVGVYKGKNQGLLPLESAKEVLKKKPLYVGGKGAKPKVAVIGSGIAGAGCAWALDHSGKFEVHLYEREKAIGGNATTITWPGEPKLTSCVSVLAWPKQYFRNYEALLEGFGIQSSQHPIRFFVAATANLFSESARRQILEEATKMKAAGAGRGVGAVAVAADDKYMKRADAVVAQLTGLSGTQPGQAVEGDASFYYAHGLDTPLRRFFQTDLDKWRKMRTFVTKVNSLFVSGSGSKSFYAVSLFNPLNTIPLRLLSRMFGVSDVFWRVVFVSLHSSSFLTTHLDHTPAQLLEVLEDMVSMDSGGVMSSWLTTSEQVFDAMTKTFADRVYTLRQVRALRFDLHPTKVGVVDYFGETEIVDKVVLATDAQTALSLIPDPSYLERTLLAGVSFTEDKDTTFLLGQAHTDTSILPASERDVITARTDGFANFIQVSEPLNEGPPHDHLRYENTFCLQWATCLQSATDTKLVSYNNSKPVAPEKLAKTSYHVRDHPEFHPKNMLIALALHMIQASRNKRLYYCGSSCTPGNGHDLSLLSGFVIADAIGAPYPFQQHAGAYEDFLLLRTMMTSSGLFTSFFTKLFGGALGVYALLTLVKKLR